jgi:hypothetical protein
MSNRRLQSGEQALVQQLEARCYLAASLTGSTLKVQGTNNNDAIVVTTTNASGGQYIVTLNGKRTQYARSKVKKITITGLDGNDKITLKGTIAATVAAAGGNGNDTITGSNGKETFTGADGDDVIRGGNGNDIIKGGNGFDFVEGGSGNDKIQGDGGDDALYGDAGDDTLTGGEGNDTLGGDDEDKLVLKSAAAPADIGGNDRLDGGPGNDWLLGGIGTTGISDSNGSDTLTGGAGIDVIDRRSADDTVTDLETQDIVPFNEFPIEGATFHTHADMTILLKVGNAYQPVRVHNGIGFFSSGVSALHTHDDTGKIHFESAEQPDYALSEFFEIWGVSIGANHVGRHFSTAAKPVTFAVNGQASALLGAYEPQDLDQIEIKIG